MNTMPIIRLEVQGMQYAIQHALTQHTAEMDQYIQEAVTQYCKPDNIRAVVLQTATAAIDAAVKSSIEHFFRHGKGRSAIKEAVEQELEGWR